MICIPAWRYGATLSITVGLLYLACALVAMAVPDALARAVTVVVHGLNIGGMTGPIPPTTFGAALLGLVYVAVYAFVAGWLFGAVRNTMARAATR
jgi:hypothetical protein